VQVFNHLTIGPFDWSFPEKHKNITKGISTSVNIKIA